MEALKKGYGYNPDKLLDFNPPEIIPCGELHILDIGV